MFSKRQTRTAILTLLAMAGLFAVYMSLLGPLTDYPQLEPQDKQTFIRNDRKEPALIMRESEIAAIRGFGPDCEELNAPLILESRKMEANENVSGRGFGIYIYAVDYEILKEDPRKIRLHPFSMVSISRGGNGNAETDEIHTIRSEQAFLEFDRPVELTKLSSAKPLAGWAQGQVELKTNNHTTDNAEDDVVLYTPKLYYNEQKNMIWSEEWIRLVEKDAVVTGIGMELELNPKAKPGDPKPLKKPAEARKVRLLRDVRFDLQTDDDGVFGPSRPVAGAKTDKTAEPKKPPTPTTITARGEFVFDLETNQARFQRFVQVLRKNPPVKPSEVESIDQLECDELQLQFQARGTNSAKPTSVAKPAPAKPGLAKAAKKPSMVKNAAVAKSAKPESAGSGGGRRLQSVTATGKQVILLSDSQRLQATGNYLFHDSDARRTILRGDREMVAVQDDSVIHARSLVIEQGDEPNARHVVADGPDGWLEMKETNTGKPDDSKLRIRWQGRLTTTEKSGGKPQLVTITDGVELDSQSSALRGDVMKIWLVPVAQPNPPVVFAKDETGAKPSQKTKYEPVKVEASGNVSARTDDLAVLTENLVMDIRRRQPAPVKATPNNATPNNATPNKAAATKPAAKELPPEPPRTPAKKDRPSAVLKDAKTRPIAESKKKEPLDLRARRVHVVIEKDEGKSKPVKAWAEGDVLVTQSPAKAGDKPLEIRGQTLQFERFELGDLMKVGGDEQRLAVVKTNDLELAGRQTVHLDEIKNRVDIVGPGYLIRQSANDLTGKTVKAPQPVRVDWQNAMTFDGKLAIFEGNVKATQGTAEINCQNMDVTFDRATNFKEMRERQGSNDNSKASIETVDCDKDVVVYDGEKVNNVFVRHTTMKVTTLHYDNKFHTTIGSGPDGKVQIVERNAPKRDDKGKLVAPKFPYQLTEITFNGQMRGDQDNKTVRFYEKVHILHTPINRLEDPIDEEDLPADGMIIDADDRAEMSETVVAPGQKFRDFQAFENVKVHARDYWGLCEHLSYDQQKDLLIFNGTEKRKAKFFRRTQLGGAIQESTAITFRYWRKTGKLTTDGSDGFNALDAAPQPRKQAAGKQAAGKQAIRK